MSQAAPHKQFAILIGISDTVALNKNAEISASIFTYLDLLSMKETKLSTSMFFYSIITAGNLSELRAEIACFVYFPWYYT